MNPLILTDLEIVNFRAFRRLQIKRLGRVNNRIFGLALALASVKNGFLLVDKIGNGIHYSVQPKLWNFIFAVAQRLNVQVFATPHSWDSVEAFQEAAGVHTLI